MSELAHGLPSISIVIATWNAAASLQSCLDSVASQSLSSEVIVIDGGSTDGTASLIAKNNARIAYWESEPDHGIYHAWNKALDHVTGDWVYFLGADDVLASPVVIEQVARQLARLPEDCSVAYGSIRLVSSEREPEVVGRPWSAAQRTFYEGSMIPHQGTFHRRTLFERVGRFDESYRICGDYDLLLRELPQHPPAFLDDIIVADTSADGVSGRDNMFPVVLAELHRARRQHGLAPEPWWRDTRHVRSLSHAYLMRWFGRDFANRAGRAYRGIVRRG